MLEFFNVKKSKKGKKEFETLQLNAFIVRSSVLRKTGATRKGTTLLKRLHIAFSRIHEYVYMSVFIKHSLPAAHLSFQMHLTAIREWT